jgi:hypothetical protein
MTVQPDARGKVYRRIENGAEDFITVKEALALVNDLMMNQWDISRPSKVREMSSQQGRHLIKYRNGTTVLLVEIDAADMPAEEEPGTWSVASHRMLLHRFTEATENGRAVCNKSFRPWRYGNGFDFKTRTEHEASEYADLYTFCPRCERK